MRSRKSADHDPKVRPKTPKPPVPKGNEHALSLCRSRGKIFRASYWDLWFAIVAAAEGGGDLDRVIPLLGREKSMFTSRDQSVERKISHIRDLQNRLRAAGRSVDDLLAGAGELARREARRASSRVLGETDRESEWSEPMHRTPRQRRLRHALRGYWPHFPISPQTDADELAPAFRTTRFFTENQSFGLARKLDAAVERAEKLVGSGKSRQAQALLRAILTIVIELMAVADDSCGSIGDSFQQAFKIYLNLPRENTGITDEVFLWDLLSLLIWEDYGLTWRQTEGYFGRLNRKQADRCIDFLRDEVSALTADGLGYQADGALTLLGQIVAEQGREELFEELAARMGSRHWERIIRLVDRAVISDNEPLAHRVFKVALTPTPRLS